MPPVDSTAQVLASGSQDLAALAGLFCTNSVERNALATHFGYGAVASSGLSILGVLGLVRSSVKLVLGLDRCHSSGFSLDSLRGIFGYQAHELANSGELYSCDEIFVTVGKHSIVIEKTQRTYDSKKKPILTCGRGSSYLAHPSTDLQQRTLINVGNPDSEKVWLMHPLTMAVATFVTTGATSWLILTVRRSFYWALYVATVGLHSSMFALLAIPLWHSFAVNTPSRYASARKIKMLLGYGGDYVLSNVSYTEYDVECGRSIFFHGDTRMLWSWPFRILVLCGSMLCATSYVCQYIVLKDADATYAGLWVGLQANFALARLLFWLINPNLDELRPELSDLKCIDDADTEKLSLYKLIRLLPYKKHTIPLSIWEYIRGHGLHAVMSEALHANHNFDNAIRAWNRKKLQRTLKSKPWYNKVRLSQSPPYNSPDEFSMFVIDVQPKALLAGRPLEPLDSSAESSGASSDESIRWRLGFWRGACSGKIRPAILARAGSAGLERPREQTDSLLSPWLSLTVKHIDHAKEQPCHDSTCREEIIWCGEFRDEPQALGRLPGLYYWPWASIQPNYVIHSYSYQLASKLVDEVLSKSPWSPPSTCVRLHEFMQSDWPINYRTAIRHQCCRDTDAAIDLLLERMGKRHKRGPLAKLRKLMKTSKNSHDSSTQLDSSETGNGWIINRVFPYDDCTEFCYGFHSSEAEEATDRSSAPQDDTIRSDPWRLPRLE